MCLFNFYQWAYSKLNGYLPIFFFYDFLWSVFKEYLAQQDGGIIASYEIPVVYLHIEHW